MSPRNVFHMELEDLKNHIRQMGEYVEISYHRLDNAWRQDDEEGMRKLLDTDREVRETQKSIEAQCLKLLTRQQPVAKDLRLITASLKAVTDIERVGDHVGDIAELCLRLPYNPENPCIIILEKMYREVKDMFGQSLEAFVEGSVENAQRVVKRDDVVDGCFNEMKEAVTRAIQDKTLDADSAVDSIMFAKYLEKIGDHVENIGAWTIFQTTGDMEGSPLY